jgi:hypothetical protein
MVLFSNGTELILAEVPEGPICTNEVLTCAIASPLHWSPVATVIPPAVAPNAKDSIWKMDILFGISSPLGRRLRSVHSRASAPLKKLFVVLSR